MCWKCGKKKDLTAHHVIPKGSNPVKNMTIPLCNSCHKKLHSGEFEMKSGREVLHFSNVKQKNGKYKMMGNLSNGKICFIDQQEKKYIEPLRKYDCKIKEIGKVAFATDVRDIEGASKVDKDPTKVEMDKYSILDKRFDI